MDSSISVNVMMLAKQLLVVASLLSLTQAQETVLGVYIFHRHGDRTSKSTPPTSLTDLGYQQVWQSGDFYRNRYVDANATSPIFGLASDLVKTSQLSVEAPVDTVLQNSAVGFLQGLYPPVGATLSTQVLANGTSVAAPLNGYQLIPVNAVASASSGANSENSAWLQGQSGCHNAIVSSNNYFFSDEYEDKLKSTEGFYSNLLPVINRTFTAATNTFKNAYTVFDLINVALIHNTSIQSSDLLTAPTLHQLQTLADVHEFNLAYNSSEPIRAIAGSTLAAQIVQHLNATITGKSQAPIVSLQFGAYASFLSFFGLAQLPAASANFTGLVGYASSMVFELVTNASLSSSSSSDDTTTTAPYPSADDIAVRFLFANGSAAANPLTAYPLFGRAETLLPWSTFASEMARFAVGDLPTWCTQCGNSTGVCAAAAANTTSGGTPSASQGAPGEGGMSRAVVGAIGAMVTLAVVFGIEALVMLVAGLRIVRRERLDAASAERLAPAVKA
ncbi:uncharacterized protein L3040_009174 [Drepanopeziza brunnea f. sp. 'multigermtubi']|uniref:Histidine acid phosphatase n=1 Tax=Marssonina brunnea f. sp. multigermtubi (strain MB_m1) TaxID=1072389 RepID=K1X476_MARBU|nr:histidine acid phosphatase [Drepanopeziza brunnea f. sp. 'multigermtubi' MB_m1]EKD15498.1 histidine acid phosphatase [Drepanopeziza brunnea f. sp. 'multigermtubi' MB_m1]KAJ5032574.1 hypothetical protein L3040_009174 [Drepanopeziza brunnea f. sp. 'multigermtubi']